MQITIKTSTVDIMLEVQPSDTVECIKNNIQVATGINRRFQKLFFSNEKLEDGRTLSDYKICESSCIEFELVVPSFDEVLDATFTLNGYIDSHSSVIDDKSSLESVLEAQLILKAFIDSHSCCATAITDILKTSKLADERNTKTKVFCETLLRGNSNLMKVRDEQNSEIKSIKVSMENIKTELAVTKAELASTKIELANQKIDHDNELANIKTVNQSLFDKVEKFKKLSHDMGERIEELTTKFSASETK